MKSVWVPTADGLPCGFGNLDFVPSCSLAFRGISREDQLDGGI